MQIVIDIPEEIYNSACASNNIWNMRMAGFVCSAIANGTPLESVIEDIQAEISHMDGTLYDDVIPRAVVLEIIDKHISGGLVNEI